MSGLKQLLQTHLVNHRILYVFGTFQEQSENLGNIFLDIFPKIILKSIQFIF